MLETSAGQDGSDQEREAPRRKWGDRTLILSAVLSCASLDAGDGADGIHVCACAAGGLNDATGSELAYVAGIAQLGVHPVF